MSRQFAAQICCLFAAISLARAFLVYPRSAGTAEKFIVDGGEKMSGDDDNSRFKQQSSPKLEKEKAPMADQITAESSSEEAIDKIFENADANADNRLTLDEYLHSDPLYAMLKLNEFIKLKIDEFKRFDTNGDGFISRREFHAYLQSELEATNNLKAEYFGQLFQDFDDNFDLKFDAAEVRRILASRFRVAPKSEQTFRRLFRAFDANADGLLDLDEYLKVDESLPFQEFRALTPAEVAAAQREDEEQRRRQNAEAEVEAASDASATTTVESEAADATAKKAENNGDTVSTVGATVLTLAPLQQ